MFFILSLGKNKYFNYIILILYKKRLSYVFTLKRKEALDTQYKLNMCLRLRKIKKQEELSYLISDIF